MLAFSGGSASKLHPVKTTSNPPLKDSPHTKFLASEEAALAPQEFPICPDVGLPANGTDCTMATSLRQQVQVERPYVEDHDSRFHATGSANHGCNECCSRTDDGRRMRANDPAQPRAPRFTKIKEIVMAKVIEFYTPKNFRKTLRTAAQPQLGKIIEFCPQTKRSA